MHTKRLDDGFSTIITLENIPNIQIFEKDVTPPSYSAGGPIDTTTMRNIAYRTQAPRKLKSLGQLAATVAYATSALPEIWNQIGVNQLITVTFPDGASLSFYGWIEEFTPSTHTEGEQPTANLVIQTGMRDNEGNEVAPLYEHPHASESGE